MNLPPRWLCLSKGRIWCRISGFYITYNYNINLLEPFVVSLHEGVGRGKNVSQATINLRFLC